MNDNLFEAALGDGGCEGKGAGTWIDVSCCGCACDGRLCRGCSVCVAVVGEDVFELVSASDAALDETEKYADVGVGVTVVWYAEELGGTGLVCTVGRVGGDP